MLMPGLNPAFFDALGLSAGEHYSKRPNHRQERSWRAEVQSKKKYIQQIVYERVLGFHLGTDQEHLGAVHCPVWHQRSDGYLNTPLSVDLRKVRRKK